MLKKPITLTLASLALIATALPYATYAQAASCRNAVECYEQVLVKLQQVLIIVEAQQAENEQLKDKVAKMEEKIDQLQASVNRLKATKTGKAQTHSQTGDRESRISKDNEEALWQKFQSQRSFQELDQKLRELKGE